VCGIDPAAPRSGEWRCGSCSAPIEAPNAFCSVCFAAPKATVAVEKAAAVGTPVVSTIACPSCGGRNPASADRCSICFAPLGTPTAKPAEPPPAAAESRESQGSTGVAPLEARTQFDPLRCCPLCGHENSSRAEFCGACWGRLPTSYTDVPTLRRMVVDFALFERWEVHGVKTGFVDRSRELATVSQLFESTVGRRLPQLVSVIGEAGIGKSRFAAEFIGWLREHASAPRVLAGACREDEPGAVLGPLARLLRDRFEIREHDPAIDAQEKVRQKVSAACPGSFGEEISGALVKFLGLSSGAAGHDTRDEDEHSPRGNPRVAGAIARFLEGDARATPLVICIDDLHNAAPEFLAAFQHLVSSIRDAQIVFVIMARPSLLARHPSWFEPRPGHFRLDLGPLSPDESANLVRGIVGTGIGDAFVQETCRRAGGNPLFLEELCRIALEGGPAAVRARALPANFHEAVRARLRFLDEPARAILEMASVVGSTFWLGSLVALRRLDARVASDTDPDALRYWFGVDEADEIQRQLEELRGRDFVTRNPNPTFPEEEEYLFKQNIERDLVYAEVPPERASRWHRFLAQWILQRRGGSDETRFAQAARHRELAGDTSGAARLFLAAADRARASNEPERAAEFYERGLGLLAEGEVATRLHVLHGLGDALTRSGQFDRALTRFREMLRCAWLLGERGKSGAAYNRIGRLYRHLGRYEAAMAALSDGHTLFLEARDWRGVAASLDDIGQVHRRRGNYEQAIYHFQEALQLRRELGDPRGTALSLYNIGEIQRDAGRLREAEPILDEALSHIRATTDRTGIASVLSALAALHYERGDLKRAESLWKEALDLAREVGGREAEGRILGRMGELSLGRGDLDRAEALLTDALECVRAFEDRAQLSPLLRALAETYLKRGEVERAAELCEEALDSANKLGSRLDQGVALRVLGEVHAQTLFDDTASKTSASGKADGCFSRALALFEDLENDLELGRTLTSYGNYLLERGDMERGREMLLRAREILERREAARSLARAQRTIGELP
jgi:tetratricopeptide (TPR) repeat protein